MNSVVRVSCCAALALLGALFYGAGPATQAYPAYSPSFDLSLSDGTPVQLSFSAEPQLANCRQVEAGDDRQVWMCRDHLLELTVSRQPDADLIGFRLASRDGFAISLYEHSTRVAVPASAGDALFTFNRQPARDIMETSLGRPWVYFSAANRGIPYAALVDKHGLVRLGLGLLGQDSAVLLRGESSGDKRDYVLTLRQTDNVSAEAFEDAVYVSRSRRPWYRDAQRYTEIVDRSRGYEPPEMPEAVLNPTYDSWYWTLDRIDRNLTWKLAERSRALGFQTYLIDAGWDTLTGEYVKGLKGSTGDYTPPAAQFPDFGGLIQDIRDRLGMKVMLWMQPYALGRRSIYYPRIGSLLCSISDPAFAGLIETPFLCPRTYGVRSHMAGLFERILRDYRPDAFWFDWQEEMPQDCDAPHLHEQERFGDG